MRIETSKRKKVVSFKLPLITSIIILLTHLEIKVYQIIDKKDKKTGLH